MGAAYAPRDPAAAASTVRAARSDPSRVLLEGIHPVKHALRFDGDVEVVVTPDRSAVAQLLSDLAPDVTDLALERTVEVDGGVWRSLVPRELPSPALGVAVRPQVAAADVMAAEGPVVALEHPRHLGNLGAVLRVAAAAAAGGVLTLGSADPWHPTAVRSAAGLGFALPVAAAPQLPETERPVLALSAEGTPLTSEGLPDHAVLLVGTERGGLTPAARARADATVAIPMRPGVSSLNLATAVAIALYAGR
ncbi:MAG: TrmH family RNA methyltransferase [Nitriliruptoraceae bacterium]